MSELIGRRAFLAQSFAGICGTALIFREGIAGAQQRVRGTNQPFKGIYPIVQTPFFDDESIDEATFRKEINFIVEAGGHGMSWPQIASEFTSLTHDERLQHAQMIVGEVRNRIPVIVGVQSTSSVDEALEFARHAEQIGAHGIISLPPYFLSPTEEQVAEYFATLAQTVSLPIFIQNSGGEYGPAMSIDTMVALGREYPSISYVKEEAQPVLERITELTQKGQGVIKGVYSGAGGTNLINEMNNGSRGSCPSSGMIDVFSRVFDLYDTGNKEEAEQVFAGLSPMFRTNIRGMHWLIKEKEILRRRGIFPTTKCRTVSDFTWSDEESEARFATAFDAIKPLFTYT